MATLTITIPDASATRIYDAFALIYGWTAASGAKDTFAKAQVIAFIKATTLEGEMRAAAASAAASRATDQASIAAIAIT